jgi:hypothetical protein
MDMKLKLWNAALLTVALAVLSLSADAVAAPNSAEARRAAMEKVAKLPISFEPTANPSRFVARSGGYAVSVGAVDTTIAVIDSRSHRSRLLSFNFDKPNAAAAVEAYDVLPGVTNYYIGANPEKWRLGVKNYARLRARAVYPGVDVVYYGDNRNLEFDFVLSPKADPGVIAMNFSGMDKLYKDDAGSLVAEIGGKPVRLAKPYAYQQIDGVRKPVPVEYVLSSGRARLQLGEYDHNRELIVDPQVSFATYLGGSSTDSINAITVDTSGAIYVTGTTSSSDFPSGSLSGATNAFLVKYSADGTTKEYTDMIGGTTPYNATASGNAIALDPPSASNPNPTNVYIAGTTNITDLPGSGSLNPPNSYEGGDSDAFIMIFSASSGSLGNALNPSDRSMSYLGGSAADSAYGIAVDSQSNVIVVGQTCSDDFPVYSAFELKTEVCVSFVTKLDNNLDIASQYNGYLNPLVSGLVPTPMGAGVTFYFSETFGGQPVAPPATAGGWTPCTAYPAYAIVEDTANPPNVQFAMNSGTSGIYQQATSTSADNSIPIPSWNTGLHGQTPDGMTQATSCGGNGNANQSAPGVTWMNLGPVAPFPGNYTEAYGVALDPVNDIFLAGGTNSPALNNSWVLPPVQGWNWGRAACEVSGAGAWILKVSGTTGGCVYLHTMETTATDVTATVDTARAIAVDPSGRAYVTGTMSKSFGSAGGGYTAPNSGGTDVFVARWNTAGSAMEYGASLGGSANDQGLGIAVDSSGAAYLTGLTQSADFPLVNPLVNPNSTPVADSPIETLSGGQDAFVAKLSADGSALLFSAYLGGSAYDQGNGIATDLGNNGNIYVAGMTYSPDLVANLVPMSNGSYTPYIPPQSTIGGDSDGFLAMIAGNTLPVVTVLPGSLQFSNVDVGATSSAAQVTYYNTSAKSSVNITNIQLAGDFTQVFENGTPADCSPGELAAGTQCAVWVAFSPTTQGTRTGTLTITDDATSAPHVVNLSGQGAIPYAVLSAASLTFNNVYLGTTSSSQTLTVENTGKGTLNFSSISITGDFLIDSGNSTCSSSVPPGGACTIAVDFQPTKTSTEYGKLTISYNSSQSPLTVGLTGNVALVQCTINPTSYSFGSQPVGTPSASQTFTVANTDSSHTLEVNAASASIADFQVTNNCPSTLSPGNSCSILVVFDPTASGTRSGTLTVSGNGTAMTNTISLSGTGTGSGALQFSPSSVSFSTAAGATGQSTLTVSNSSSTVTFTNLNFAITPSGSDFSISPSTTSGCGSSLAAGATCNMTVSFSPASSEKANSTDTATLTVSATGASNSGATVPLTGNVTSSSSGGGGGGGTSEFTMTPTATSVSVTQGNMAIFDISVTPQNGSTDTLTFSCSGPSGTTCSVSPTSLKLNGSNTTSTSVTLSVATNGGSGGMSRMTAPGFFGRQAIFALLPFTLAGILLTRRRRGLWALLVVLAICLTMGMAACGSSSSSSGSSGTLAVGGPYTVNFTATSQSSSASVQLSPPLSLYVTN